MLMKILGWSTLYLCTAVLLKLLAARDAERHTQHSHGESK